MITECMVGSLGWEAAGLGLDRLFPLITFEASTPRVQIVQTVQTGIGRHHGYLSLGHLSAIQLISYSNYLATYSYL